MQTVSRHKNEEPFAFWLVNTFLSSQETPDGELGPISNQEFLAVSALILVAFCLFALFVVPFEI